MDSFFIFYEKHIVIIYAIHIVISLVLALFSALYLRKRYSKNSEEIKQKDKTREEAVELNSSLFKLLFKVSLHKNNFITNFLFIFFFNLPIPLIGYIFTIWIVWYLGYVTYEKKVIHTNVLNLDEFGMSFLKVERIFGEGSMSDLMTSQYAPKAKKLKALSSLAANISPVNLQIVRETLKSTDDEIRMFGYAVINKAEKTLNQKINKHLEIIHNQVQKGENKDNAKVAISSKELAFLYWEMVYTELSHDSLKNNFLNQSIIYIELSKDYYNDKIDEYCAGGNCKEYISDREKIELQEAYRATSSLYMLMGRIHLLRGNHEAAKAEFTVAQELLPNNDSFILPYLAEVYYLTGKYDIVKSLLNRTEGLELNATLHPIVEQWKMSS